MKKLTGIALLLLLIILVAAVPQGKAGSAADKNQYKPITHSPEEEKILYRKMEASEQVHNLFQFAPDGSWIYPDNYTGLYDDGEYLVIAVKQGMDYADYEKIAEEYSDVCRIKETPHSLNEMMEMAEQAADIMLREGIQISSYAFRATTSRIVFTTTKEYAQAVRQVLVSCNLMDLAVVEIQEASELNVSLRGGDSVYCVQKGEHSTLGACGIRWGQDSLLLCGHATAAVNNTIKKSYTNHVLGTVSVRVFPGLNGTTNGDYSIVNVTGSHDLNGSVWNGWDTEGIRKIYGYRTDIYENLNVIKNGMTTGWRNSTINCTNAVFILNEAAGYRKMTGMVKVTTSGTGSQMGDSGGPYFWEINNKLYFIGIHSGRSGVFEYFTPYLTIRNATGFNPYTNGD